jgi:hypothetical protein
VLWALTTRQASRPAGKKQERQLLLLVVMVTRRIIQLELDVCECGLVAFAGQAQRCIDGVPHLWMQRQGLHLEGASAACRSSWMLWGMLQQLVDTSHLDVEKVLQLLLWQLKHDRLWVPLQLCRVVHVAAAHSASRTFCSARCWQRLPCSGCVICEGGIVCIDAMCTWGWD